MKSGDFPQHWYDHDAVADLVNSKADIRLATMIGVGYLENYLGDLLRIHLGHMPEEAVDFLLKKTLNRVSARIDFAGKLGLIADSVCRDLHIFVDIRNRFAHRVSAKDCSDPVIAEKLGQLKIMNAALVAPDSPFPSDISEEDKLRLMIAATVSTLHQLLEQPFQQDKEQ